MVESIEQDTTGIQLYVAGLFPTPVAIINFGEQARELNGRLVEDIDDAKENNLSAERTFSNNSAGWQSISGLEQHYHSFVSLKNLIHQVALPSMEWTGYDKEYLQTSVEIMGLWANLIDAPGGWSSPHVHGYGDTLWSGVYYPTSGIQDGVSASTDLDLDEFNRENYVEASTTSKRQGVLAIIDPAKVSKSLLGPDIETAFEKYPHYGADVNIIPRESLIVLFPAWVEHYVTPIAEENFKRYSISFCINRKQREVNG